MKRLLAAVLAFVILFSQLPGEVLAAGVQAIQTQLTETDPVEVTEPEETEPEETEPEETEPEETEPEETEPEETEPEETEPEETEPEETEPLQTEPQETVPAETIPESAMAPEPDSGTCGETVAWNLSAAGVLTLSGTGEMEDFRYASQSGWYDQRNQINTIVVGEGITSLGNYAFTDCTAVTSVSLPESLERIGHYAFDDNQALTEVIIPDAVTTIGKNAFYSCQLLESVTLPLSWTECESTSSGRTGTSYQGGIFQNCKALKQISLPEGMLVLPDYAFSNASYLETVILPDTLQKIGEYAFYDCNALTGISIPEKVTQIGSRAFRGCKKVTQLPLPAGLTTLGAEAFYDCIRLTEITVPAGVTVLEEGVFCNCKSMQTATLPKGLTFIGKEAFYNCAALTQLQIPDSVYSLGYRAFANCTKLESIHLPAAWTECPGYRSGYTGASYQGNLFGGCKALLEIALPQGMTQIPAYAFYNASYVQTVTLPASIRELGASAFAGCNALKTVTVPEGVTTLPEYAFSNCRSLETVQLPSTLESIGREAFYNCAALTQLQIPDSVYSLGYRAFANCTKLESIHLPAAWTECPGYRSGYTGASYQGNLFGGCKALLEIRLPDGMTQIPAFAFYNANYVQTVTLPATVTELGVSAFANCTNLKTITLPEGVTALQKYAFSNCDSLQALQLPQNLTAIGEYAFYDCAALQSLVLPEGITALEKYTFAACRKLQQIQLPAGLLTIGDHAFVNCESLESVAFPENLTSVGRYAFSGCRTMKRVVLPESVAKIGDYAFYSCPALEEIVVGPDTEIGKNAFASVQTKGTLNNITWEFNMNNRTLTVSGTGDMVFDRDEENKVLVPWKHLRSLTKVLILSDGLMSVDDEAFRGFTAITGVDTGKTLRRLGAYSFADCTGLKRAILGEGMKLVETGAFSGCTAMTQLVIIGTDGDLEFGPNAIPNSAGLTVTFPETEKEYGDKLREEFPEVKQDTWDNTLPGRDVVLVLDVSGSMNGSRIQNLKTAVNTFLDRVGGTATNSRVAIVTYDSSARVISDFSWNMDQLKSMVDSLDANGGTHYLNALNEAEDVLQGSDEDVRAMIFFTDGDPNDSETNILDKCTQLRKQYRIYTVGFQPSNSGHQLLQKMAGGGKNYYHATDVESLAEAFKALSGGVGSEVEEEEYYSLTVQRQFVVRTSKNRYPIDIGFTITVGDRTYRSGLGEDALVSEENITADIPEDFTGSVTIAREGYVTYNMPVELIGNQNVVIMHPDTETDPFPQQLLYQPVKGRQSYRNCFERVNIQEAALMDDGSVTQRFYVDIQWQGHKPGQVWLSQGEKTVMLQDKQFADVAFSKTFLASGGTVYLNFSSPDGYSGSIKTDIYVSPADNRIPLELGDSMSIPQEDMAELKILGDQKFTIDFSEWSELPIKFEVESDGTVSGTIGLHDDGENLGVTAKGEADKLREAFRKLEKHEGMTDDKLEDMLDELTDMGKPKTGKIGVEGKVWMMGYFSGKLDPNGGLDFKEIKVYVIAEGGITYTLPFTVMGVPLYFQTQLQAAIKSGVALKQENDNLLPEAGAFVETEMTISVGGGIGCEGVLSGGVQGDGTAGMDIPLEEPADMEAYVKASFSLVGTLLGLKGQWTLWESPKYYFYKDRQFTWTKEMAESMNEENFTLLPEPGHNSVFYATGLSQSTNNVPYDILKSDTTQFTDPKLITYSDGTRLVVWLDAVPGRTGADVYGVYYSYFNGSSWSSPKLVDDDGTNDYGLSLTEVNGEAYVLWHDYDMVFGKDLTEVQQAAEHINISIAKFDRSSLTMNGKQEFSAGGYDHQPQLRASNGQLQLAWKCGVTVPEPMYLAVNSGGSWSQPSQQEVSWYREGSQSLPSDYNGEALNNLGEIEIVEQDGLRAIVYRSSDSSGNQNVFVVYCDGTTWGKPIQLTRFDNGTYVDAFSAELHNETLQLIMNVTQTGGKSNLVYMQQSTGTDLAVVRADYDHFTLVPGKSAVFFARVTNRGAKTEDMMKLRLVDGEGNVLKTQLSEATVASGETVRLEMNYVVPADNSLQKASLVVLPVHGQDVNEANNSMEFDIFYRDISVEEIRAFVSDTNTTVTARIVNRGNEILPAVGYVLRYRTPDGEQIAAGTIRQLQAGEVETLNLTLDRLEAGEMLYLQVAELENENLTSNNQGMATIQSVYGDVVKVASVTLDREYVALEAGQSVRLQAVSDPADQGEVKWRVEADEGSDVITVAHDGTVTALNPGTAYAVAYVENDDGSQVAARCRVDVTEGAVAAELTGVKLGSTAVTTNVYSTQYAAFDVILQLQQNQTAASSQVTPQAEGVAIEAARFANDDMAKYFDLVPSDDRKLLVVPKEIAMDNAKSLKSSYSGKVVVRVDGQEYSTDTSLKLTVKKTLPTLKAAAVSFNSFYPDQTGTIRITGATATQFRVQSGKTMPSWLKLAGDTLTLTDSVGSGSRSAKVYLEVNTLEWRVPLKVTCSVSARRTAPSLKLTPSTVTFASGTAESAGVTLTLKSGKKNQTLSDLHVIGVQAPAGFEAESIDLKTGTFLLRKTETATAGKKYITVSFADTQKTVTVPVIVKFQNVKLSLSKTSVSLNAAVGDSTQVTLKASPADHVMGKATWRILNSKKQAADNQLSVVQTDGTLKISTNENTLSGTAYKLYVSIPGSKEAVLTVNTLKTSAKKPTLSLKASGAVDLLYPDQEAKITASFKNYSGDGEVNYTWKVETYQGKTLKADVTDSFRVRREGKQYYVGLSRNAQPQTGLAYKLTLTVQLPDGQTCASTVGFTVRRTAVKLKLTPSSVALNKKVGDSAQVKVSVATKNVSLTEPLIRVLDSKGKTSVYNAVEYTYADGVLQLTAGRNAQYGNSYQLKLRATQQDPEVTLKVSIRKESASKVSVKLKTGGTLDMSRVQSKVTVTPTYSNLAAGSPVTQQLKIFTTKNGKTYDVDVTDQFMIRQEASGAFTVSADSVNHTRKYRVLLTGELADGTEVTSALTSISVTAGKVSLKANPGTVTLYRTDRLSRGTLTLEPKSDSYRPVARISFKDTRLESLYELYDYGNGEFAIGFRNGQVGSKAKSQSVTLNVFLEGNNTAKPNGTVTVKLTVR